MEMKKRIKLPVSSRSAWRSTRRFPVRVVMYSLALPVAALLLLMLPMYSMPRSSFAQASSTVPTAKDPDIRCAGCHAEIYRRYQLTAMGRGSGPALQGFLPGELQHAASDVHYRVFLRDGLPWMSFHRDSAAAKGALDGERKLEYFVGSGRRGRTFLYQQENLWFELPINYYTRRGAWDMAPNYGNSTHMPAPLPVDANCLHCHATGVAAAAVETRNRLIGQPFTQGGIGCNTCHGDPGEHLAHAGHSPILNPDKLPVERRDSACIQCHLEGDAVVYRPGRSLSQFRVGDNLQDIAVYFVFASQTNGGARATSQYEALLQSACKRRSGDRLTCTTCHDPHSSPLPDERVAYFRGKCLSCHSSPGMATQHHPEQRDCAACHMPTRDTTDISHAQVTDHNIQRYPAAASVRDGETLVPVGNFAASDRDFGLAYALLAQHGNRKAGERALVLLRRAETAGAADEQLHLNLGFLDQVSGRANEARTEYTLALQADPQEITARSNLAVLDAASGKVQDSLRLLDEVVTADPSQTAAGLNLAFLQCSLGHIEEARRTATRLRAMDPDSPQLRELMRTGRYGGQICAQMVSTREP
jgi:tetratricopeptide (TPR) repeat protein